jgi:hypothetical protein
MKTIGAFNSKKWGRVTVMCAAYGDVDGPLAVILNDEDGQRLATLSVNMGGPDCSQDSRDLPQNCFYVKRWSENEQLASEAYASGLFKLRADLPAAASGFVTAPVWQIAEADAS